MSVMLYRPGSENVFGCLVEVKVFEEDEVSDALKAGWVDSPFDVGSESRDELEAKAKELGVSFNARTSDETLKQRILEAG